MKRYHRSASISILVITAVLAFSSRVQAHEKWFHDAAPHPTRWMTALQVPVVFGVGIALVLTALVGVAWRARNYRDLIPGPMILGATQQGRAKFYAPVPLILGIHVGLPLLVMGIRGELFSPNNQQLWMDGVLGKQAKA